MKYNEETVNKICECISKGYTQKDAAKLAGVSEAAFYKWLNEKVEFVEAVKKAERDFVEWENNDLLKEAKKSLKELICGTEYEEVKTEYIGDAQSGAPKVKKQTRIKKRILPNATAVIFALCNRDPEHWQNRVSNEITGKITSDTKSDVSLKNVPDELLAQVIKAINEK